MDNPSAVIVVGSTPTLHIFLRFVYLDVIHETLLMRQTSLSEP